MKNVIIVLMLILLILIACEKKVTEVVQGENDSYFSYPPAGSVVSGTVEFKVKGTNIDRVFFHIQSYTHDDSSSPFTYRFNTNICMPGNYTMRATVYYEDGETDSITRGFQVN